MKVSNKVWQMVPGGYRLLSESLPQIAHDAVMMKGGGGNIVKNLISPSSGLRDAKDDQGLGGTFKGSNDLGRALNPAAWAYSNRDPNKGAFDAGGWVNNALDPLDLFGGQAKGDAEQAKRDLPGQLTKLNELQAGLSRYDTNGPFGSSAWSIDPETGRYTQTTNLNDSQQRQFDSRNAIAEQMMGKAGEWAPQGSFDYNKDVQPIADQQYAKISGLTNPVAADQNAAFEAKMANIGVKPTSDAYKEVASQRGQDASANQFQQRSAATTAAIPLAQQQRQQRMTEMAQLLGSQQLNSPTMGGNGIDVGGATDAAYKTGIDNANMSAAQRNANMQSMAGLMKLAYPNGFG